MLSCALLLPVLPLRLFFPPSFLLDAMTSSMFRRRASLARQRRPPSHKVKVKRATMSGSRRYLGKPPKRCLERTSNQLHPRGPSTISIRKARTSVVSFSQSLSQTLFPYEGFYDRQVWPQTQFFLFPFCENSLICLVCVPDRRNAFLYRAYQQLSCLCLGPLKGFLS